MAQFDQTLNSMIDALGCSNKDLAAYCKLSASALSRYRNGNRKPTSKGKTLQRLADGISAVAQRVGVTEFSDPGVVQKRLIDSLSNKSRSDAFADKLNRLMNTLGLYNTDMAKHIGVDASYLSRIRSGRRYPAHEHEFVKLCSEFASVNISESERAPLKALLEEEHTGPIDIDFDDTTQVAAKISSWLLVDDTTRTAEQEDALNFLKSIDDFDLDSYRNSIDFEREVYSEHVDEVARSLREHPHTEVAYTVEGMRNSYLEMYRLVNLSPASRELFICSGLPMNELLGDGEYYSRWITALLNALSSGIHVSLIHNLDRSYSEIIRGLLVWIPLYATGIITPYYLEGVHDRVFRRAHFVSNDAALYGECIGDDVSNGVHRLTTDEDSVKYYQRKAEIILDHAKPLMEIFTSRDMERFEQKMQEIAATPGNSENLRLSLPYYTMPPELLQRILDHNDVDTASQIRIKSAARRCRENVETFLKHSKKSDFIVDYSDTPIAGSKQRLFTEQSFVEKDIYYTPEEYEEHLEATRQFEKEHENYSFKFTNQMLFHDIQISIFGDKYAIISKTASPALEIVIYHPRLCEIITHLKELMEQSN